MRCRPTLIGPFSTPELEDRGHVANRIFYVPRFHYFAVVFRIATIFAHEGLKYRTSGVTATSRTPPWLASGWGCRGRRLSRGTRSLDTRSLLWHCRLPSRRHERVEDAPVLRSQSSRRCRDDRAASGTRRLRRFHYVTEGKLGR